MSLSYRDITDIDSNIENIERNVERIANALEKPNDEAKTAHDENLTALLKACNLGGVTMGESDVDKRIEKKTTALANTIARYRAQLLAWENAYPSKRTANRDTRDGEYDFVIVDRTW